jgi:TfoX/Sxy family transcriptional regulator of competence genes
LSAFPKPDQASESFFRSLVPDDPRVEVRPMFGNLAAFVNKNMFLALFGSQIAVRLSEEDRPKLLAENDTSVFAPMAGREMKDYVTLPGSWRSDRGMAERWVERSLDWVGSMPPKKPKTAKKRG